MGRLFGTFGVRGVVGEKMTPEFALGMGKAFATHLGGGKIAIGSDTRTSSPMLKDACISGLVSCGAEVIDLGVAPTPAIQFACAKLKCDGGASITASHNPAQYNGIKLLEHDGIGLQPKPEARVEDIFFRQAFASVGWNSVKPVLRKEILTVYRNRMLRLVDGKAIRRRKPRVVVDCANGAGCLVTPELMRQIGCEVHELYCEPDGRFPGRNPEPIPENLRGLMKKVKSVGADFGIALDGDADRCILIDEQGQVIWGDRTFAIVAGDMTRKGSRVVTTVATSHVVRDVVERKGGTLLETRVGDLVVSKRLKEVRGILGGEENGGLIFPKLVYGRDGTLTGAKLAEVFCRHEKPFSEINKGIPMLYQKKVKVPCPNEKKAAVMEKIMEGAGAGKAQAGKAMPGKGAKADKIITVDGFKAVFGRSWVIVRPSGTEPLIRVFSEAPTQKEADELNSKFVGVVQKCLKN